ncbi:hypothetical protein TIFTF001_022120 [Ficus carica]|uniref:Trichome birefringence-like C-terminal domain-containing protein n=1 Tax=Ficus carica TaxID=3494 RepID=A0AA88AVF9_FICCA|nr:hypothetical protein TIFTF001_022120 [Ficus carica]
MQNKAPAFVGDSLGRQQFQSLMCMITGGNERDDVVDVSEEYGIAHSHGKESNTVHNVVNWVNSQLSKYPNLKVFYRSISPSHFVGGEWNTGGTCDNTTPLLVGKEVEEHESSDHIAASAVKGTRVKLLDITAISKGRDEAHIVKGVPDTRNEILFAQL